MTSCTKNAGPSNIANGNAVTNLQLQVNNLPKEILSSTESGNLLFMREEEKLARDVYTGLYNKWGAIIFNNISASEQTHMDGILMLLNKYGLPDPAGSNAIGVFTNKDLQELYNQLMAEGNASISAAYNVGATIEDLDLYDLGNAMGSIDNQDIRFVYESLSKGSRNHMRSFYGNLGTLGIIYNARFITQAELELIINSDMERGF